MAAMHRLQDLRALTAELEAAGHLSQRNKITLLAGINRARAGIETDALACLASSTIFDPNVLECVFAFAGQRQRPR